MAENGDTETYKVLIVGNTGVGKTVFLMRYFGEDFQPAFASTLGINFRQDTIERYDKKMMLQFWDTAGQERYSSIVPQYFRGGAAFILMFDLTNEASFKNVNTWLTRIKDSSGVETPLVVLVGNKSDLKESRVITPEQCKELAQSFGYEFFETSAKDLINVKETVDYIIEKLAEPKEPSPQPSPPTPTPTKRGSSPPASQPHPPPPRSKSPSSTPERKYKYCYC